MYVQYRMRDSSVVRDVSRFCAAVVRLLLRAAVTGSVAATSSSHTAAASSAVNCASLQYKPQRSQHDTQSRLPPEQPLRAQSLLSVTTCNHFQQPHLAATSVSHILKSLGRSLLAFKPHVAIISRTHFCQQHLANRRSNFLPRTRATSQRHIANATLQRHTRCRSRCPCRWLPAGPCDGEHPATRGRCDAPAPSPPRLASPRRRQLDCPVLRREHLANRRLVAMTACDLPRVLMSVTMTATRYNDGHENNGSYEDDQKHDGLHEHSDSHGCNTSTSTDTCPTVANADTSRRPLLFHGE